MSRKQALFWLAVVAVFCAVAWFVIPSILSRARRSDEVIRKEMLDATPIGANKHAVMQHIERHFPPGRFHHLSDGDSPVLVVSYGSYGTLDHFPWLTEVNVLWHFSANGRLVDVTVERWVAAP